MIMFGISFMASILLMPETMVTSICYLSYLSCLIIHSMIEIPSMKEALAFFRQWMFWKQIQLRKNQNRRVSNTTALLTNAHWTISRVHNLKQILQTQIDSQISVFHPNRL